jgi:hypothetical protein
MRYARSIWEQRKPMSAIAHSCASCGNDLPVGARFCASCGARTTPAVGPVSWSMAERRVFGVVPGATVLAVARNRVGRFWAVLRSRIRLAAAVVESRLTAGVARLRLQSQLRSLEHERAGELQALGDAFYRDDRDATGRIRSRVGELDRRMKVVHLELERIDRNEGEQIGRARMEGGPTNIVEPEPPIVPEPEPVPHEPPGPVIVPEPEPEPHEPPGPVIVPEPSPPAPTD